MGYFFGACWTMCSGSIDTDCVVLQRSCILQLAIAYALVASAHGLGRYPLSLPVSIHVSLSLARWSW